MSGGTGTRTVPVNDVFSPEALARPQAFTARMRAQEPVLHATGHGSYVVLSYAECVAVLGDPAWGRGHTQGLNATRPGVDLADMPGSFLLLDPPEHTRLRRLVSHAFTPRSVEAQRAAVVATADRLVADARDRGEVDLVTAFAHPLALSSICRMLGVPVADLERFGGWAAALVRGLDPEPLLSATEIAARGEAVVAFARYFADMVAARRAEPRDDLVSHLARVSDDSAGTADRLTSREIADVCVALLVAGAATTTDVVASAVLALHRRPDQLALLRERPELVRPAVEEFLRFDPPIAYPQRTALVDTAIAGRPMPRGSGVHLALGAANRDPAVYADPDRLDVTRFAGAAPPPRQIALSHGVHFCIGAMLARLEVEAAIAALVAHTRDLTVLDEDPPMRPTVAFRGLATLPVRLR